MKGYVFDNNNFDKGSYFDELLYVQASINMSVFYLPYLLKSLNFMDECLLLLSCKQLIFIDFYK